MQIEVGERPSVVSTPERVSPKRLSYALCLLVLVLDQASKLFVLHSLDLEHTQPLIISAFFDLILVWNRGIPMDCSSKMTRLGRLFCWERQALPFLVFWSGWHGSDPRGLRWLWVF